MKVIGANENRTYTSTETYGAPNLMAHSEVEVVPEVR